MTLVLVTGATGRLGSAAVAEMISHGYSVRAVVRPGSAGSLPQQVEKIEFDLASGPLPRQVFEGVGLVAHLAGLVGSHPYGELIAANANATKNVVSNCPSTVERAVLASSVSVYGEYRGQVVDEGFATKPHGPYGKSKLAAESFARDYCGSISVVFLRFGMIYGPGFEQGYFDVFDYLSRGKMRTIGDGSNRIPLLHISDAVQAIMLALSRPIPRCREYNIVGYEQLTQKELLSMAAKELGVPAPAGRISPAAIPLLAGLQGLAGKSGLDQENLRQLAMDRAYSCQRAKEELGWQPGVPVAQGLREMVRIYKEKKSVE